ncbi:hypothetical protein C4K22_5417 [Pseudomonas chlororaphis subsp. aurantiaca]|nr:hypothetical protein C4K22_5417 [Pseudomonas chlororaphis subsp. aurantiaca]AZD44475.1 hypothetical protein C4K21_5427 [Pseudomonas chlororaphis subsp. aurantiaca]
MWPCSRCRAPRGCDRPRSGRCSWGRRRSFGPIAAFGSGYTDRVYRTIGLPPVAAAEPARLRSPAKQALLLGAQEALRAYRSLRQRLQRRGRRGKKKRPMRDAKNSSLSKGAFEKTLQR